MAHGQEIIGAARVALQAHPSPEAEKAIGAMLRNLPTAHRYMTPEEHQRFRTSPPKRARTPRAKCLDLSDYGGGYTAKIDDGAGCQWRLELWRDDAHWRATVSQVWSAEEGWHTPVFETPPDRVFSLAKKLAAKKWGT